MRKDRYPETDRVKHGILPQCYRIEEINMAHYIPLAVNKTNVKILAHFFWPGIRKTVAQYCKTCKMRQIVGKHNQKIQRAPLQPVPAFEEPLGKVIIDCVDPLPKTKSFKVFIITLTKQILPFLLVSDAHLSHSCFLVLLHLMILLNLATDDHLQSHPCCWICKSSGSSASPYRQGFLPKPLSPMLSPWICWVSSGCHLLSAPCRLYTSKPSISVSFCL